MTYTRGVKAAPINAPRRQLGDQLEECKVLHNQGYNCLFELSFIVGVERWRT